MQMLISAEEIVEARQPFEREIPRDWLDAQLAAEPATGFHATAPSQLRAHLTRVGRDVLVDGSFVATLRGECRRCLRPVEISAAVSFTRNFVPASDLVSKPEHEAQGDDDEATGSFAVEDVDDEPFNGRTLDLAPTVREALLLESPAQPLCREECRGLCPVCGADRNTEECGHAAAFADPRWAALKDVKIH